MKVINISNEAVFELDCERCHSTIQYSAKDTTKDFRCQVCKQKLAPTWEMVQETDSQVNQLNEKYKDDASFYKIVNDMYLDIIHRLNIGDTVPLLHSIYGNIIFDVVAKDYLIPGTVTLLSSKCITKMEWDKNNVNKYSKSSIRHWLNTEFLNGFAEPLRNSIKTPDWECHYGTLPIILNDKITIPSMTEMGISHTYSKKEGTAFAYNNISGKFSDTVDGESALDRCWTRTPRSGSTDGACGFGSSGSGGNYYCSHSFGVPVCFII